MHFKLNGEEVTILLFDNEGNHDKIARLDGPIAHIDISTDDLMMSPSSSSKPGYEYERHEYPDVLTLGEDGLGESGLDD